MYNPIGRRDKISGMLLGLAIGDALGVPIETQKAGSFDPITDYRAGEHRGTKTLLGEWSDDTAMALHLAESLISRKGFDATDILFRWLGYLTKGEGAARPGVVFGVGGTIQKSLLLFQETGVPYPPRDNSIMGNGGIMRTAPVVAFAASAGEAALLACLQTQLTHNSLEPLMTAGIFAHWLWHALEQPDALPYLIDRAFGQIQDPNPEGSCQNTIRVAGWAFQNFYKHPQSPKQMILEAVNLGGDADTNGAVTGALAGAYFGASGLHEHLIDGLVDLERILTVASQLEEVSRAQLGVGSAT